jgi:hypothetical protein
MKKILIDCCVCREKGRLRQNEAKADNLPVPTIASNLSKELAVRLLSTLKIAHVEGIPKLLGSETGSYHILFVVDVAAAVASSTNAGTVP